MNVLIYGDSMLDVSINGMVDRISPEAPVPILLQDSRKLTIGGAANVAQCLKTFGVSVTLVTCVGDDQYGIELKAIAESHGIVFKSIPVKNALTTVKTRFWSSNQQLFRHDDERLIPSRCIDTNSVLTIASPLDFNLIIFSDYGKGFVTTNLISSVHKLTSGKIPIICDPKGSDASKYKNVYSITPNFKEALALCGFSPSSDISNRHVLLQLLLKFRYEYCITSPIITLAEHGIAYCIQDQLYLQKSLQSQLADPTGAGDTALAALSFALCSGYDIATSVKYACAASSYTVTHVGTGPCPLSEMHRRYQELS